MWRGRSTQACEKGTNDGAYLRAHLAQMGHWGLSLRMDSQSRSIMTGMPVLPCPW